MKTIEELRKEFELILGDDSYLKICFFSEKDNMYKSKTLFGHGCASYLNGAWYMFQELNK